MGGGYSFEVIVDAQGDESEGGAALDTAGSQDAPNTLAPDLTGLPARALRGLTIQHHEADRLLDKIVKGFATIVICRCEHNK